MRRCRAIAGAVDPRAFFMSARRGLLALVLAAIIQTPAAAIDVPFTPETDLRTLARSYLGDADLWPAILKESGVARITDLVPGQPLKIPTDAVTAARNALEAARQQIQSANSAGAQLFAFDQITAAIAAHDNALEAQKAANWTDTLALAREADTRAAEARVLAQRNRDQAAEARLSDRQGWVEGQRPEDFGWADRQLNAILIEEEKIRTLSRSTAQITFRDSGRLRLNANSHAVIQRMRVDPLKREEDAKVSLVEGDFYALLGGGSDRKTLEVDVPDVNAQIDSGDFWVRQDQAGAKFTNYDNRRVEIATRGERVELGRNEGVVIRAGAAPQDKIDLVDTPVLLSPPDDGQVFNATADLRWAPVTGAAGYWLEVAIDANFNIMVDSVSALTAAEFTLENLEPGLYYWRVLALDRFGLPGPRSLPNRFDMRIDTAPPFLRVDTPTSDQIYRIAQVLVSGESEPGAQVLVDGKPAAVDATGGFKTDIVLPPGRSTLKVLARDPAGNETERDLEVVHTPDTAAEITFNTAIPRRSARHFIANGAELSLSGKTEPNARLEVANQDGGTLVAAASDLDGLFAFRLPVLKDTETFKITVISASGHRSEDTFTVSVDRAGPDIALDAPLPRLTSVEWLALRGAVRGSIGVTLNGREIPLADDRFDEVITLIEGVNEIEMVARDAAGNITVESWSVQLDLTPPAYVSHDIKPGSGGRVELEVKADDASGLAKAAPFTLRANNDVISGFLRYNKLSKSYRGVVAVASAEVSSVRLADIELQDDAGNRTRVRLE